MNRTILSTLAFSALLLSATAASAHEQPVNLLSASAHAHRFADLAEELHVQVEQQAHHGSDAEAALADQLHRLSDIAEDLHEDMHDNAISLDEATRRAYGLRAATRAARRLFRYAHVSADVRTKWRAAMYEVDALTHLLRAAAFRFHDSGAVYVPAPPVARVVHARPSLSLRIGF